MFQSCKNQQLKTNYVYVESKVAREVYAYMKKISQGVHTRCSVQKTHTHTHTHRHPYACPVKTPFVGLGKHEREQ